MKKLLPKQYARILYDLTKDLKKNEYDEALASFVNLLHKHQMMSQIDKVTKAFEDLVKENDGVKQLKITSAYKLSDTAIQKITKQFGKKVEVETTIDDTLVGGVLIQDGFTIFDASIKAQLEKIKAHIS